MLYIIAVTEFNYDNDKVRLQEKTRQNTEPKSRDAYTVWCTLPRPDSPSVRELRISYDSWTCSLANNNLRYIYNLRKQLIEENLPDAYC
jgi:hypothetical protein